MCVSRLKDRSLVCIFRQKIKNGTGEFAGGNFFPPQKTCQKLQDSSRQNKSLLVVDNFPPKINANKWEQYLVRAPGIQVSFDAILLCPLFNRVLLWYYNSYQTRLKKQKREKSRSKALMTPLVDTKRSRPPFS